MNHKQLNEIMMDRFAQCDAVMNAKAKEYSPNDDRLSNFRQAAGMQAVSIESALMGMLAKHIIALCDYSKALDAGEDARFNLPRIWWDEKIGDSIAYLVLLDSMVAERYGP